MSKRRGNRNSKRGKRSKRRRSRKPNRDRIRVPPPDPERWLPKWQRKKYRKLALKKGIRVTQGDISGDNKGPTTANIAATSSKSSKGK